MDISRMADISSISRTTLTHSAEHRTQEKSSTLAADHTDAFIKSEAAFTPAYTKRSAQKQPSDNNLTQRENSEDKVGAVKQNEGEGRAELLTQGVQHIIRAMLVKQGEVLTGNVPSVGAKLYAAALRQLCRRREFPGLLDGGKHGRPYGAVFQLRLHRGRQAGASRQKLPRSVQRNGAAFRRARKAPA